MLKNKFALIGIVLLIVLMGIGVYLATNTTVFKPKASTEPITNITSTLTTAAGQPIKTGQPIQVGSTFNVSVNVDNPPLDPSTTGIASVGLRLTYDQTKIKPKTLTKGYEVNAAGVDSSQAMQYFITQLFGPGNVPNGKIVVVALRYDPNQPTELPDPIRTALPNFVTIQFEAIAEGSTSIDYNVGTENGTTVGVPKGTVALPGGGNILTSPSQALPIAMEILPSITPPTPAPPTPAPPTPPPPPVNLRPVGAFQTVDNATCTVSGWAQDPDDPSTPIQIQIFKDGTAGQGTMIGQYTANLNRPGMGPFGFMQVLTGINDSTPHQIYIWALDSSANNNAELSGSPQTITCVSPANQAESIIQQYGQPNSSIFNFAVVYGNK